MSDWLRVKDGQKATRLGRQLHRPGEIFYYKLSRVPAHLLHRIEEVPVAELPEPDGQSETVEFDALTSRVEALERAIEKPPRDPGAHASAVVRFVNTAAPGMTITFSIAAMSVPPLTVAEEDEDPDPEVEPQIEWVYQEADVENLAAGVWTNGANAAASAASFADAINDDMREIEGGDISPNFAALVLSDGVSVLVYGQPCGHAERYDVTSSSATVEVEDMGNCRNSSEGRCWMLRHQVSALDMDAGEITFILDDAPVGFALLPTRSANGELKASPPNGSLVANELPPRLTYTLGGSPADPLVEGDFLHVLIQG